MLLVLLRRTIKRKGDIVSFEVFPKDIDCAGISWFMMVWLWFFGKQGRDNTGAVWCYVYRGTIYVTKDPIDSEPGGIICFDGKKLHEKDN